MTLMATPMIEERIDRLIDAGTVTLEDAEDTTTILECARRYIEIEARKRKRATSRGTERAAVTRLRLREQQHEMLTLRMTEVVEDLTATLRAEWSAELLDTEFATGDGQMVSWRDATRDQHSERALMLEGLAAGDLHTASIHRAAIRDLDQVGVATLGMVLP